MSGPNTITPAQLMRLIGLPDQPAIIDVRQEDDRALNPRLIPGSFPWPHDRSETLVPGLKPAGQAPRRAVVVCHRGLKLSEGVAALLRHDGIPAETLEGGTEAWAAADLPMIPQSALPATNLWVTRHRPKIDRIACPWLIRRFVDATARFLYVAPAEVPGVAARFNATPFDIEGVDFSHHGPACTFDMMLDRFALHTPALDAMAQVIRGADTDRHDLAPQAAGLLALSVGYSRQYRDDIAQLAAVMPLYDALFRWARDGQNEGHDWPKAQV